MGRRAAAGAAVTAVVASGRTPDGAAAAAAVVDGGRAGAGREAESLRLADDQSRYGRAWTSQSHGSVPVRDAAEPSQGKDGDSHSSLYAGSSESQVQVRRRVRRRREKK